MSDNCCNADSELVIVDQNFIKWYAKQTSVADLVAFTNLSRLQISNESYLSAVYKTYIAGVDLVRYIQNEYIDGKFAIVAKADAANQPFVKCRECKGNNKQSMNLDFMCETCANLDTIKVNRSYADTLARAKFSGEYRGRIINLDDQEYYRKLAKQTKPKEKITEYYSEPVRNLTYGEVFGNNNIQPGASPDYITSGIYDTTANSTVDSITNSTADNITDSSVKKEATMETNAADKAEVISLYDTSDVDTDVEFSLLTL